MTNGVHIIPNASDVGAIVKGKSVTDGRQEARVLLRILAADNYNDMGYASPPMKFLIITITDILVSCHRTLSLVSFHSSAKLKDMIYAGSNADLLGFRF